MSFFPTLNMTETVERLSSLRQPVVLMHRHPDGDTVGSAVALMHVLKEMGASPVGLCADPMPERLSFLAKAFPIYTALPDGKHDIVAVDVDESLIDKEGKLRLERADLAAFAHGEYFELGKKIGTFGFSAKKKKKPRK